MIAAAASTKALWYLTRGSGIVSLVLLTASTVLGVTTAVRWASPRWPRFVTEGLHKNISLLSMVFLAVHIATAIVDGYVPIRWIDAVVPFTSAYRPFWLGLGALAFDMLLAVIVTSLLRVRIGHGAWRAVHWLAYACWPVAVLHGLGAGSDNGQQWMLFIDLAAVAAVAAAAFARFVVPSTTGRANASAIGGRV
ncbi:MAG: ferric reductase-like transmembrane domain-containing protein [Acidimicrobiia bacterium]|nr:ferric reductase-like transmembrane domain-containing protein [Acidimicrobiia bacterium]